MHSIVEKVLVHLVLISTLIWPASVNNTKIAKFTNETRQAHGGLRCVVAGNSVAIYNEEEGLRVYKYDEGLNEVTPTHDYFIPTYYGFTLDANHLVYSNIDGSVSILQRHNENEPYSFQQKLYLEKHSGSFAIDGNILIVGEYDQATIYHQNEDDFWEEVGEINEFYYHYQLSDGVLLGTQDNALDSYSLEGCIPDIN